MAKPGFWNDNSQRDYPFLLDRTARADMVGGEIGQIPYSAIVDAGFIFGYSSSFATATDSVWLSRVKRMDADTIRFEFSTDAASAAGTVLRFDHDISTEYVVSEAESSGAAPDCNDVPEWEGFLATGDLTDLAAMIPNSGDELLGITGQAVVEPATIQNFAGHFVSGIGVASDDRTRATTPEGCRDLCWPDDLADIRIRRSCISGMVVFREGYNCAIQENLERNQLTFTAAVGQGEGEPCEPVEYYAGETPPQGRSTLDGAISCGEVVRSVGGAVGPVLDILAGGGAQILFDSAEHKVVVDLDLRDMVLSGAFDPNEPCDSSMGYVNVDECDCGPA